MVDTGEDREIKQRVEANEAAATRESKLPGNALAYLAACSPALCSLEDGRAAWLHAGSCMSREAHVQFCESLGVRFPGATHPVLGFQFRDEAERFLQELKERMGKFG
jgi:hypothetical protein